MKILQNDPLMCSTCHTNLAVFSCTECNGRGYQSGWFSNYTCKECFGAGYLAKCPDESNHHLPVYLPNHPIPLNQAPQSNTYFQGEPVVEPNLNRKTCPICDGNGTIENKQHKNSLFSISLPKLICHRCHGKGWIL